MMATSVSMISLMARNVASQAAATRLASPRRGGYNATMSATTLATTLAPRLLLPDLRATEALGARLAALLRPGDAVLLDGPLGAGKSALARALIRAAADEPALEVPSPSYTLVQEYDTRSARCAISTCGGWTGPAAWWSWGGTRRGAASWSWNGPTGWARCARQTRWRSRWRRDGEGRVATLHGWADRLA